MTSPLQGGYPRFDSGWAHSLKMLVDIHAHLDFEHFKNDLNQVIENAKKANIKYIINSGVDKKRNLKTLKLAEKYDIIKASLGIYPTEAEKRTQKELNEQINFIEKNKKNIIAIGEIGLDFYETKENYKEQKELFQKLIPLAEKTKLPVVIHSRKAEKDVIEILESSKLKNIIMHCFSGKFKLVKQIQDNGWYLSIPPIIAFSHHFQKVVETVPLTQIFTETDAPFLSPIKGKRNEPAFIAHTINKISEIKNLDKEEVEKIIFMNFQKVFLK